MKTKIGVIGIGNMGRGHSELILADQVPLMELTAVCDTDPAQLAWCTEKLHGVPPFAAAEEMMDSGLIDSVLIAIPQDP